MYPRRALTIQAAVAVALFGSAGIARSQSSYRLTDLGTGEALAVNQAGSVVGFQWNYSTGHWYPFIWDAVRGLRVIAGTDGTPVRVNNNNEAVGYVGNSRAAYFTEAGGTVDLNSVLSPADQAVWFLSTATDINDSGIVIGNGSYNGANASYVLDLRANPPTISLFPVESGWAFSTPEAMSSSGLIVGESNQSNGSRQGFTFGSGAFTDIPLKFAHAMNEANDVAGRISVSGVGDQAAFWPSGASAATLIGTLGGFVSTAYGVNLPPPGSPKTVVGQSDRKSGDYHGFRWQVGGKITDLTSLVSNLPNRKWYVRSGQAVNGSGLIVGQASDGTYYHAVVLSP